jgi:AAA+ ATPase superfamily predicted ATPase
VKEIIGRTFEIEKLNQIVKSEKSEFVALYGRRRVGKTFLVREYFKNNFAFYLTGIKDATLKEQLYNFSNSYENSFKKELKETPINWQKAFNDLSKTLGKSKAKKKVIFIDELPWLATPKSNFLFGL